MARNARERPDDVAFVEGLSGATLTWREYETSARQRAAQLSAEYPRGARVLIDVGDGPAAHVEMLACELAGLVGVGVSARAGTREREHLAGRTSGPQTNPEGLWFLNSTSGTTGLPKIVMHDQARWFAFHRFADEIAHFTAGDVFASALPPPFGFGLWTRHFTPAITGAPCVVFERFDVDALLAAIAQYRVTVLAAVSTQFVMMLNSLTFDAHDVSSLRILFTGGEMVPYERAKEFEDRTGAYVLQFYGSNETGALSRTSPEDPQEQRLRTAGRVIPEMHVRLLDVQPDGRGVPAGKGPALCLGYWDDEAANAELFTKDGWMRMGDLATIDDDGYLTVAGRTSDFIIRGGKNISAAQVEDECATHPAIALCAAVAMPDTTFGERVCLFAEAREPITLDDLRAHLTARGTGKELWPERLVILDELPRSSGAKVAKAELRERATETHPSDGDF